MNYCDQSSNILLVVQLGVFLFLATDTHRAAFISLEHICVDIYLSVHLLVDLVDEGICLIIVFVHELGARNIIEYLFTSPLEQESDGQYS